MHKNECLFTFPFFSHYKRKALRGCGILPAKTACKENEARRGKIERRRAERGITEQALERDGERWEEGGLCTSLLLLALLFLNGLVLLVGRLITRALRLKWSRAAFAWAGLPFFYFKMVISVLGVRTGERLREYTGESEESKRVRMLERENSKGIQGRKVG